jgi:hypothetical protein
VSPFPSELGRTLIAGKVRVTQPTKIEVVCRVGRL